MSTKCIVLGENIISKKISFSKYLSRDFSLVDYILFRGPDRWGNIELICKNYSNTSYDLLFAYDTNERSNGILYLGYWNDGTV